MFISEIISSLYPDPVYQMPKLDYAPYFMDMQRFTSAYLDESMLAQQSGYAFSELIHRAINDNKNILSLLKQADMCALINWSYEYDSDYSHVGPYLAEKYNVGANLLDITEQGSLCLISALHVLSAFFSQQKINHALIIGFEQRALPIRYNCHQALPQFNGISVISLSSKILNQKYRLKIIESELILEKNFEEKITALEKNHTVYCYLLTQQSNVKISDFLLLRKISVVSISLGILPLFIFFDQLQNDAVFHEDNALCVVLIVDIELKEWGMVVMQNFDTIIQC